MWEELWDGGTQPPPQPPPKGGEPLIKANLLKKNQEKTKMPSPRVELELVYSHFGFCKVVSSETICVGKTLYPKRNEIKDCFFRIVRCNRVANNCKSERTFSQLGT